MKRILVPTDFSPLAESALKIAAQIAKKHDGEIFLLHLLDLPLDLVDKGSSSQNLPESIFFMKLAHQRFTEAMEKPYLKDLKIHETVEFSAAFEGIMEVSQNNNCDLIIMGSHGAEGAKEVFIGSNTEKVVRYSEIPVLVVKHNQEEFDAKKFVYATNLSIETAKSFQQALSFAEKLNVEIDVVFINTPAKFKTSKDIDDRIKSFKSAVGEGNYHVTVQSDKNTEDGILNYARKVKADVIGIGTHGRKGLSRLINGSLSEDLVNHAKRPVVTFKIK
ncbi:universal stress protein [Psychroflexus maritimus]|uniref:Universal stress protein n=1 Tax=Psychroflexus maritimus TaxID=2714865 RepID=A0A967ACU9_9FLAO|nr:universal stress protein [Psychroflexus maritimus]NGZ89756.1 universal stress protein [Psychroflexus maritimus]